MVASCPVVNHHPAGHCPGPCNNFWKCWHTQPLAAISACGEHLATHGDVQVVDEDAYTLPASCRCALAKPSCLTGRTGPFMILNMQRISPNARKRAAREQFLTCNQLALPMLLKFHLSILHCVRHAYHVQACKLSIFWQNANLRVTCCERSKFHHLQSKITQQSWRNEWRNKNNSRTVNPVTSLNTQVPSEQVLHFTNMLNHCCFQHQVDLALGMILHNTFNSNNSALALDTSLKQKYTCK